MDKTPITVTLQFPLPGHGRYRTSPEVLDLMMERYLPASVGDLRRILTQKAKEEGLSDIDYSDLKTTTEHLMILAELHGYGQ